MSDTIARDWQAELSIQYDSHALNGLNPWHHVVDALADTAQRQTDRLRAAESDKGHWMDRFHAKATELGQFKTQVRDLIIEKAQSGSICHDGANRALERLGLPGIEREFEVEVEVELESITVTVTVKAVDEDSAHDADDLEELIAEAVNDRLSVRYDRPSISNWTVDCVSEV